MNKIRTTVNLTPGQRKKLEVQYIELLKQGISCSYSRLIGDAIDYYYDDTQRKGGARTILA